MIWHVNLLHAQAIMLLKKRASKLEYQFLQGEKVRLKLKTNRQIMKGSWHYDTEKTIVLAGQIIDLTDIKWIDVSSKEKGIWLLRKGQDILILAGLGYLTVSQLNSLIEREKFETDEKVFSSSANMVAAGLLCRGLDRLLRGRKARIDKSRFGIYFL
jgi:hypothetical protein